MLGREWLSCSYVTRWPCRNHFKVGSYPPGLDQNGVGCCPNLPDFVYRILGLVEDFSPSASVPVSLIEMIEMVESKMT